MMGICPSGCRALLDLLCCYYMFCLLAEVNILLLSLNTDTSCVSAGGWITRLQDTRCVDHTRRLKIAKLHALRAIWQQRRKTETSGRRADVVVCRLDRVK